MTTGPLAQFRHIVYFILSLLLSLLFFALIGIVMSRRNEAAYWARLPEQRPVVADCNRLKVEKPGQWEANCGFLDRNKAF